MRRCGLGVYRERGTPHPSHTHQWRTGLHKGPIVGRERSPWAPVENDLRWYTVGLITNPQFLSAENAQIKQRRHRATSRRTYKRLFQGELRAPSGRRVAQQCFCEGGIQSEVGCELLPICSGLELAEIVPWVYRGVPEADLVMEMWSCATTTPPLVPDDVPSIDTRSRPCI